jgi:hypothetical protein
MWSMMLGVIQPYVGPVQGPLVKWHLVAQASWRCINATSPGDSGCSGTVGCLGVRVHRHPRIPICRLVRLILLCTQSMTTLGVVLQLAEKHPNLRIVWCHVADANLSCDLGAMWQRREKTGALVFRQGYIPHGTLTQGWYPELTHTRRGGTTSGGGRESMKVLCCFSIHASRSQARVSQLYTRSISVDEWLHVCMYSYL